MVRIFVIFISILLLTQASNAWADGGFGQWKKNLRQDALAQGINASVFDAAMKDVTPIKRIIQLDRKQPEGRLTFNEYLGKVISKARIKKGAKLYKKHQKLLNEIGNKYNVQPRFIVALWGIETSYGANTGGFYVPQALATLAYDGRRSDFFRKELIHALKILQDKHIDIKKMKGSWAGAMGQSQFMPSSFLRFAQDYNNDGRRNIWTDKADVFASIANYLSSVKWDKTSTWGRKVQLPKGFDKQQADTKIVKKISDWQKLGIRKSGGGNLPKRALNASIVIPDGNIKNAYMIYDNYKTLLDWNRSLYFATSVGILSDAIAPR